MFLKKIYGSIAQKDTSIAKVMQCHNHFHPFKFKQLL